MVESNHVHQTSTIIFLLGILSQFITIGFVSESYLSALFRTTFYGDSALLNRGYE
jgi:hypothetical protein